MNEPSHQFDSSEADEVSDGEQPLDDGGFSPIIAAGAAGDVAQQIEEIPASDGADVLESLPSSEAADIAEYLDPNTAGRIFAEMDPSAAASVLDDMEAPEASMVVSAMSPDDRVDVLEHVSDETHDAIVGEMEPDDAEEVRQLEQYAPDTAGGIMTTEATALPEDFTVAQAVAELRRLNEQFEQMYYAYVIDRRRHLIGVLAMRDLILSEPGRRITSMMRTQVTRVPASMDQEDVARLMRKSNFLAVPVVDDQNRLLGIITLDDVIDVVEEEATEDVQRMFGAGAEERLLSPWPLAFRMRIVWLFVQLVSLLAAGAIIARFLNVIVAMPSLAAWQIVVVGMGTIVVGQTLAVTLRGLAVGESGPRLLWRVLYRQMTVGLLSGCAIGVVASGCAAMGLFGRYPHRLGLAAVIFLASLSTHLFAALTGVLLPFAMKRLGFDRAQSALIFATALTHCVGILATLWLASMLLARLG